MRGLFILISSFVYDFKTKQKKRKKNTTTKTNVETIQLVVIVHSCMCPSLFPVRLRMCAYVSECLCVFF